VSSGRSVRKHCGGPDSLGGGHNSEPAPPITAPQAIRLKLGLLSLEEKDEAVVVMTKPMLNQKKGGQGDGVEEQF